MQPVVQFHRVLHWQGEEVEEENASKGLLAKRHKHTHTQRKKTLHAKWIYYLGEAKKQAKHTKLECTKLNFLLDIPV
jgi:hypothetical protein